MVTQHDIYVYMDWPEDAEPVYMGVLHSETIRSKEVFSYENDPAWLAHPRFRALDPDLSAFTGKQYQPSDKSNFGLFLDSAPDRWGRTLMRRREVIDRGYEQYSGLVLEKYFRSKIAEEERITGIGSYWDNKGENEIDVIAINDLDKTAIVAEVKRNPKKIDMNILQSKVHSVKELAKYKVELQGLSLENM